MKAINDEYKDEHYDQYVITQSYRSTVKSDKLPQVQVVNKVNRRIKQGLLVRKPYRSGDRIPFIIARNSSQASVAYRAEDPEWMKKNKMPVDKCYYLTSQLETPIGDLLRVAVGWRVDDMLQRCLNHLKRIESGCHSIKDFFGSTGAGMKRTSKGLSSTEKNRKNASQSSSKKKQRTVASFFKPRVLADRK